MILEFSGEVSFFIPCHHLNHHPIMLLLKNNYNRKIYKYKKSFENMKKHQRNIIATLLAAALTGCHGGCDNKTQLPIETNLSSIRGDIATPISKDYTLPLLMINDKPYLAIPLPEDKTAEISGKTLTGEVLGKVFLFPYTVTLTLGHNKVHVEPPEEKYFLVNLKKEGNELKINEGPSPVKQHVVFSPKGLEMRIEEGMKGVTQTQYFQGIKKILPKVWFNDTPYFIMFDDFKISGIDYLPRVFIAAQDDDIETRMRIENGKVIGTETGITGHLYLPVKGKLVQRTSSAASIR